MEFNFPGFFRAWKPLSNKELLSDANKMVKTLSEKDLSDMSIDEFNTLIRLYERDALGLRYILEITAIDVENESMYALKKKFSKGLKREDAFLELPINVSTFDTECGVGLHIMMPYLFKKEAKYSFSLGEYVYAKLTQIVNKEGFFDDISKDKKIVYILRVGKKFNPKVYCDNDNLELSKIINCTFGYLGLSDNPLKMDLYSGFIESENEELYGSHLIVIPADLGILNGENMLNLALNNVLKMY